jgi:2-hydroxychromene-2-carboxylate isomerase
MVMRGLPVPKAKRLYITRDVKREADRLGIRFGHAVDPVGKPAERGLALLHHAIPLGKGSALAESFLQGVFADGIYAGDDQGLWQIAERAGLSRHEMDAALVDPSWQVVAEANRQKMLDLGCWGVPSFRVKDCPAIWGNDRLWMVEQDVISVLTQNKTTETMQ